MQIVLLALLNDGAILSIAYTTCAIGINPKPEHARGARMATILGSLARGASAFLLGDRVFHLGHPELRTMMYLTLSVAGHLTIFQARTRGPFWSIRPAVSSYWRVGTQVVATSSQGSASS